MARSAFNHSCNYRSVMAFGRAYKVTDPKEKLARLKTFTNQLFPGQWDHLRPVTDKESNPPQCWGWRGRGFRQNPHRYARR